MPVNLESLNFTPNSTPFAESNVPAGALGCYTVNNRIEIPELQPDEAAQWIIQSPLQGPGEGGRFLGCFGFDEKGQEPTAKNIAVGFRYQHPQDVNDIQVQLTLDAEWPQAGAGPVPVFQLPKWDPTDPSEGAGILLTPEDGVFYFRVSNPGPNTLNAVNVLATWCFSSSSARRSWRNDILNMNSTLEVISI